MTANNEVFTSQLSHPLSIMKLPKVFLESKPRGASEGPGKLKRFGDVGVRDLGFRV